MFERPTIFTYKISICFIIHMILIKFTCTGNSVLSGAIIRDGDRKRAPFQVLGLSPWYGTIILFLEQIAPSPAKHARTSCEDFCGCRAGEMASEIPEMFHVFARQLNAFTSVGILLKYFRRKLLQFEWSKTVSNLGMFRCKLIYIADQVVFWLMLLLHELYITPL